MENKYRDKIVDLIDFLNDMFSSRISRKEIEYPEVKFELEETEADYKEIRVVEGSEEYENTVRYILRIYIIEEDKKEVYIQRMVEFKPPATEIQMEEFYKYCYNMLLRECLLRTDGEIETSHNKLIYKSMRTLMNGK